MIARKSNLYFSFMAFLVVMLMLIFVHTYVRQVSDAGALEKKKMLLGALPLTDLCLFTEASYTRHWSQADNHTAFQDSPMALEHFPSGSIYLPPLFLRRSHE